MFENVRVLYKQTKKLDLLIFRWICIIKNRAYSNFL